MSLVTFAKSRPGLAVTAVFAAFAPLVFLITEAIAAIAWTAGTYSYATNYISDLGTTVCGSTYAGRLMCSPLHGVMNFGYVAMGVGVAVVATLLATRLPALRRIIVTALGWAVPVGMTLVATFHGGVESVANGTMWLHVLGAGVAIICGNTLAIIAGSHRERIGMPRWYAPTGVGLGVVGLLGLALLLGGATFLAEGVFERIAVYTIFAWLLATSVAFVRCFRAER